MMQAILIDPFTETIEVVDYSKETGAFDISTLLGCDLFATVYIDDEECDTLHR